MLEKRFYAMSKTWLDQNLSSNARATQAEAMELAKNMFAQGGNKGQIVVVEVRALLEPERPPIKVTEFECRS